MLKGLDVLEFGCGAAQWAIALAGPGAGVADLDNSGSQLEPAREPIEGPPGRHPLLRPSAEATGLGDESFDVVFCDYGAMTFADPRLTVPEAARLLRGGGLFAFSANTPVIDMAWPPDAEHPGDRLLLNYWEEIQRIEPPGEPVGFNLTYGESIALFRETGFEIEGLIELRRPPTPSAATAARPTANGPGAGRWNTSGASGAAGEPLEPWRSTCGKLAVLCMSREIECDRSTQE